MTAEPRPRGAAAQLGHVPEELRQRDRRVDDPEGPTRTSPSPPTSKVASPPRRRSKTDRLASPATRAPPPRPTHDETSTVGRSRG